MTPVSRKIKNFWYVFEADKLNKVVVRVSNFKLYLSRLPWTFSQYPNIAYHRLYPHTSTFKSEQHHLLEYATLQRYSCCTCHCSMGTGLFGTVEIFETVTSVLNA